MRVSKEMTVQDFLDECVKIRGDDIVTEPIGRMIVGDESYPIYKLEDESRSIDKEQPLNIYVDELRRARWRYGKSCHLFTTGSLDDLHRFAVRLGLKNKWFQHHPGVPHYDLTAKKRKQAIELGAKTTTTKKVKEIIKNGCKDK